MTLLQLLLTSLIVAPAFVRAWERLRLERILGFVRRSSASTRRSGVPGKTRFPARNFCSGFTLAETTIAMGLMAVVCTGLYGGISLCFGFVQSSRENLRATQILEQNMEVIRLVNWDQSSPTTNFVPTSFSVGYDTTGSDTNSLVYQVSVVITNPPNVTESYSNNLRMVQVTTTWNSGKVQHSRTMSTFVSQFGLQNYVW